jgi:alcohol dehydrogenase class IV
MLKNFAFATTPQLHFGAGKLSGLSGAVKSFGPRILLITGRHSFLSSSRAQNVLNQLDAIALTVQQYRIEREPSPIMIDEAVKSFASYAPDSVVAIGGGSVIDAGKAISAMLPLNEPVKDYLEGVGTKGAHPGVKIPFIAVPTTSGTGSECTKNAVISETGPQGYKRSLRHNNFVPDLAIVDPELTLTCPKSVTATSGMDAFTQLLESYLSTAANPITDALAIEGLTCVSRSLLKAFHQGDDIIVRTDMALASYLSGITLANAGLGLVHGFASPVGGYFDIPHGVICSALMASANKITVRKLRSGKNDSAALKKYATVGKIFSENKNKSEDYYTDFLLSLIESLTAEMNIPRLSHFGLAKSDFERIIRATDNKNNPVSLNADEMVEVLMEAC